MNVKVLSFDGDKLRGHEEESLEQVLDKILGELKSDKPSKTDTEKNEFNVIGAGHLAAQAWFAGFIYAETGFNLINNGQESTSRDQLKELADLVRANKDNMLNSFKGSPLYDGALNFANKLEISMDSELDRKMGEINRILEDDEKTAEEKSKAAMEGLKYLAEALGK